MRDDDDGHTVLPALILQQGEDLLARGIVQRAGRLVAQQQTRLFCQRAGDGHALLLAAGELGRKIPHAFAEADVREHLRRGQRVADDLRGKLHVLQRQKRRLARAGRADDDADLAFSDRKARIVQGTDRALTGAVNFFHIFKTDECFSHSGASFRYIATLFIIV